MGRSDSHVRDLAEMVKLRSRGEVPDGVLRPLGQEVALLLLAGCRLLVQGEELGLFLSFNAAGQVTSTGEEKLIRGEGGMSDCFAHCPACFPTISFFLI